SSNTFSIVYLINIFDPITRVKAEYGRYLLIINGYSSHINMEFITTCNCLKILLLILSPYSI
ncbi:hypothetical protein NA56DRAFT_583000, partial [Hyaloscypha hepaticicola]